MAMGKGSGSLETMVIKIRKTPEAHLKLVQRPEHSFALNSLTLYVLQLHVDYLHTLSNA